MTLHYNEPRHRYIDHLVELAAKNLKDGVIEEPRGYWDEITLNAPNVISECAPNVFENGEQFPVRLTHLTAAMPESSVDERLIQRVGLRLTFHDQYYMGRDHAPVPLWLNENVAAGDLITDGASSQVFDRPVILSARDSLNVRVQLIDAPDAARRVSVSFTGTGMLSKRPYFFSDEVDLTNVQPTALDTSRFRNDGVEPIALTDWAVHCGAELGDATGNGDIRQVRVNVRQIGNGTQAQWFQGRTVPTPRERLPAVLMGTRTGRAVVHRFPGQGLLWEPGEGITVDALALTADVESAIVAVALHGYISVI